MPSTSDSSVEILILGKLDPSLDKAAAGALETLNEIAKSAGAAGAAQTTAAQSGAQAQAALAAASKAAAQQAVAAAKDAADKAVDIWQQANSKLIEVDDMAARDLFNKRQNLTVDLLRIGERLGEEEVASDLKMWSEKALVAIAGQGRIKATQEGGFLWQLLMGQQDVAQTTANEAAKTGAVAAGVATRTAEESAGQSQGMAMKAAATSLSISQDAAKAAAGAYAALADIPVIGPVLGAGAAVATFAAVMAYDSVASFATGADNIPHDMVAQIHKGEMIIPAGPAAALRAGEGNAGAAVTNHWHFSPTVQPGADRNVVDELEGNMADFVGLIAKAQRLGHFRAP